MFKQLFGYIQVTKFNTQNEDSTLASIIGSSKQETALWEVQKVSDDVVGIGLGDVVALTPFANPVNLVIGGVNHTFIKKTDIIAILEVRNEN